MMRAEVVIALRKRPLIGETQRIIQREAAFICPVPVLWPLLSAPKEETGTRVAPRSKATLEKPGLLAGLNIDSHLLRRQAVELLHALLNIAQIQYVTNPGRETPSSTPASAHRFA